MDFLRSLIAWFFIMCTGTTLIVVESICLIKNKYNCSSYNVECVRTAGSVSNPSCSEPYDVTFTLVGVHITILTSGYFSSTNFDSRVRHIELSSNEIYTIETSSFRFFTKTQDIDLSSNHIVQIKNEAFSNLADLKYLNLSHNQIKTLHENSFKLPIQKKSLQILDLSNNQIEVLDMGYFTHTSSLLELYLQENNITYLSNNCFVQLNSLNTLNLHKNFIHHTNGSLLHLKELKSLDLSYNSLSKLSGPEFGHLTSLEYLNVSHNILNTVEGNSFASMLSLKVLDLSFNFIKSDIESHMFITNSYLKYVNFYKNDIKTINEDSFKYNSIDYVNFEHNNITANLSLNILYGFKNVIQLNITQQHIKSIKEGAFSSMRQLRYLNLTKNCIDTVDNTSFVLGSNITSALTVIDLSYNRIKNVNFLRYFSSNMTDLLLNNNQINILSHGLFNTHLCVRRLDISQNQIIDIASASLPLQKLQYLVLKHNNLSGILTNNTYSPALALLDLDLSGFKYKNVSEFAIRDLPLLSTLNLSRNEINYINPNNFIQVNRMYSLDVSYNNLTHFEIQEKLSFVKAVYFNDNKLTALPSIFSNISKVTYIDISHNNISNLTNAGFDNVKKVETLHMSYNQIEDFNCDQVNSLYMISELSLASNKIRNINLTYFKNLASVDLRNNRITHVSINMFRNLTLLQYLDVSANDIGEILPGSFQDLNMLKLLNLSSNHLTGLRFGIFRGVNKINVIDVSRNKISNIEVEVFHECGELTKLVIDYNYIKTIDVDKLLVVTPKLTALTLGGNPISCHEIVGHVGNNNMRKVEITAADLIFHEDNVNGIKCGDITGSDTTEIVKKTGVVDASKDEGGISTNALFFTWATILTVLVVISLVLFYVYKQRFVMRVTNENRLQFRNSSTGSCSEFQNDLLR